jgi:hypothetical protein
MDILHATLDGGPTSEWMWQAAVDELASLTPQRISHLEQDRRAAAARET